MTARRLPASLALLACALLAPRASAQQPIDSAYSAKIRELTPTDAHWKFTTELVSTLPASATVPTPLKVLGYVPGTLGRLSYVADLNRYFDALAAAAPNRVKKRLALGRLADPRGLAPADRARIIKETKPTYWLLVLNVSGGSRTSRWWDLTPNEREVAGI